MSIRERINQIHADLLDRALTPELARQSQAVATALHGHCLNAQRETEIAFAHVIAGHRRAGLSVPAATAEAKTSPEYRSYREAEDYTVMAHQILVTCRRHLESLDTEMRLSR